MIEGLCQEKRYECIEKSVFRTLYFGGPRFSNTAKKNCVALLGIISVVLLTKCRVDLIARNKEFSFLVFVLEIQFFTTEKHR